MKLSSFATHVTRRAADVQLVVKTYAEEFPDWNPIVSIDNS
jgi:hypothetical protein